MSALPYFLLVLPLVDLAMSNPDAGDLMLALWMFILAWQEVAGSEALSLTCCPHLSLNNDFDQ